jgi:hypothetical protein
MLESQTFPPTGKTISIIYFWLLPCAIDALFLIKEGISIENIIAAMLVFGFFAIDVILPYKKPFNVIVSPAENTLVFDYVNCFGQIRSRTIDLKTATVSFKYRLINLNYRLPGKFKFSWRLLLYKGSYFKNRIVIRQDDEIGYSKDILQQMFNLINECRDTLT